MNLQGTHTKTVNSLQRELEALRENFRITKVQLRDLEMGNDDLERHERYAIVITLHFCLLNICAIVRFYRHWRT